MYDIVLSLFDLYNERKKIGGKAMKNIYEECPIFQNETICLVQTQMGDAKELLACYSDKESVPFFNADNCHGDTFYYDTLERMEQAIKFWCESYERREFVRWTILLKETNEKIGTVEMFNRGRAEHFGVHGVLRIDLQSKYEKREIVASILEIANGAFYDAFGVEYIITKAMPNAIERIYALETKQYTKIDESKFGIKDYYARKCANEIVSL